MKLLIIYASRHGHTEKIARRIAGVAGEHADVTICEAHIVPIDALHVADAVIIAAPVYFDRYPRSIIRFVRLNRERLESIPSAFVSVSGASMTPAGALEAEDYLTMFEEKTEWIPSQTLAAGGATPFTKYNPLVRFIIRRIARAKGIATDTSRDYEYTDWDSIDRFTRAFTAPAALPAAAAGRRR